MKEILEKSIQENERNKKDACYHKVKRSYKVFPSAYASGAIAKCRKKRAGKKNDKPQGYTD